MAGDDRSITVTRTVDARPDVVYDYLVRPAHHHQLDTSGMIREQQDDTRIGAVGTSFLVRMRNDHKGDHRTENHVVVHEPGRALGWAPAEEGRPPAGHTFVWRLEPAGDATVVTQTYDWSGNTDPEAQGFLPVLGPEQLRQSLDLLARAVERTP